MQKIYFILYALLLIAVLGVFRFSSVLYAELSRATISSALADVLASQYQKTMSAKIAILEEEQKNTTLLFTGDVMLSRSVGKKINEMNDVTFPFLLIASTTRAADMLIGNLEGPISLRGRNQGSIYSFRANPQTIQGLTFAGFRVMSLANNHIWDWGRDALSDSVSLLRESGILTVGAGRNEEEANAPLVVEVKKNRIGLLSYTNLYPKSLNAEGNTPGISAFNEERVREAIKNLKQSADIAVVLIHWGDEYKTKSNNEQQRLAHAFIDAGADLVVGTHPHVSEEVEQYHNGWIAYSLGNFVFDQTFSEETRRGTMFAATVKDAKLVNVVSIPIRINDNFQPEGVPL
ncbi:MAG: CapA family protein [Candidatus Paceibacterota bacterium]|jgi:poly-gamma-glutamate synthesis protein (capsule biosynthesis protein)